jgi:hypothetical protein
MAAMSEYERQVQANKEKNRQMLIELGLDKSMSHAVASASSSDGAGSSASRTLARTKKTLRRNTTHGAGKRMPPPIAEHFQNTRKSERIKNAGNKQLKYRFEGDSESEAEEEGKKRRGRKAADDDEFNDAEDSDEDDDRPFVGKKGNLVQRRVKVRFFFFVQRYTLHPYALFPHR